MHDEPNETDPAERWLSARARPSAHRHARIHAVAHARLRANPLWGRSFDLLCVASSVWLAVWAAVAVSGPPSRLHAPALEAASLDVGQRSACVMVAHHAATRLAAADLLLPVRLSRRDRGPVVARGRATDRGPRLR